MGKQVDEVEVGQRVKEKGLSESSVRGDICRDGVGEVRPINRVDMQEVV